ncbi:TPA: cysteine hydrolase [Klebsiella oxytoca]|jgi:nicotinamidase-related amidase|nr:cysteine hydrolase [Klebsiella oxytoca]MBK0167185.1 cysteine hydrolase [Klebsiella sp. S69]OFN57202.1 cysteine hydrolase [Enterobacter sp. HMSC055A11]EJG2192576.1 cysteine hydrolase [Klebsiella oxytoca]EKU5184413.1 cysteine hydrolase [Klebsiella oxytoca]
MSNQLSNISKNSALLVMDFQTIILNNFLPQEIAGNVIRNTASLIAAARAAAVPVIYISVGFRKGYPEVSKNNTIFSSIKENGMFMADNESTAIHPEVAPAENEAVIVKRRVGAFSFTELEMILRAQGIETLILTGVTTSGVVLSTVGQAFDLDYRLVVAGDCCADPDHDTNLFILDKILPQHAIVTRSTEISEAWA